MTDWRKDYNWKEWREKELDFEYKREAFNKEWEWKPNNRCYNLDSVIHFLRFFVDDESIRILEFGGGKGYLAKDILKIKEFPIEDWYNYDISNVAIGDTKCKEPNYYSLLLNQDPADLPEYMFWGFNTLIFSTLSFYKPEKIRQILSKCKFIDYIHTRALVSEKTEDTDISEYKGAILLDIGWEDIEKIFAEYGFKRKKYNQKISFFKK